MTPEAFRKMALSLPEAVESSHMGHPDFRVGGKIFATLGYPEDDCAVLVLSCGKTKRSPRERPATLLRPPVRGAGEAAPWPRYRGPALRKCAAAWRKRGEGGSQKVGAATPRSLKDKAVA